ncbi:hypothetical protein HU200_044249 [Digitaria exilis]|uniref:Heat shock protein 70 n=1 Tax=Digitaria exilis TaxID=1010633 RepID=A0A835BCY6_9POAL|nr:hypothetical protein HU200_044249 [Digitaria exilis]
MQLVPYNFTRQLGWASIQLGETGQVLSPHHLAGILISELKHMAEAHLGRQIENAVVTVPRHVTYDGREHVRFAATSQAGFRVAKIVDEQIAAAAAHGHHTEHGDGGGAVLVFHVGGRTSHATIFKFVDGRARLIQARDDLFFGGKYPSEFLADSFFYCFSSDDFTARLVDHFVELIKQQHGFDIRQDTAALLRLKAECERAKKALSYQQETTVSLLDGVDSSLLTRAKFEELNRDLFERAMALVDSVVMQAPVVGEHRKGRSLLDTAMDMFAGRRSRAAESRRKDMVDEIVVVGGSTRIPKIRHLVKEYFRGREPSNRGGVEPDETVVHGALLLTRPPMAPRIHLTRLIPVSNTTTTTSPAF